MLHMQALCYYKQSCMLTPNDARTWNAVGTCLEKVGDIQRAKRAYWRAENVVDGDDVALVHLAHIYECEDDIQHALLCHQKLLVKHLLLLPSVASHVVESDAQNLTHQQVLHHLIYVWCLVHEYDPPASILTSVACGAATDGGAGTCVVRSIFDTTIDIYSIQLWEDDIALRSCIFLGTYFLQYSEYIHAEFFLTLASTSTLTFETKDEVGKMLQLVRCRLPPVPVSNFASACTTVDGASSSSSV
uniref:Uncharacterized protein n=1 Tax=Lygus hesperus TaxID=30085 RepID=A0A0A9YAG6_LYGHE